MIRELSAKVYFEDVSRGSQMEECRGLTVASLQTGLGLHESTL